MFSFVELSCAFGTICTHAPLLFHKFLIPIAVLWVHELDWITHRINLLLCLDTHVVLLGVICACSLRQTAAAVSLSARIEWCVHHAMWNEASVAGLQI